jgi:hypothetical protein
MVNWIVEDELLAIIGLLPSRQKNTYSRSSSKAIAKAPSREGE